jgi:hypothetical protein
VKARSVHSGRSSFRASAKARNSSRAFTARRQVASCVST